MIKLVCKLSILLLAVSTFISCGKDDDPGPIPPQGYIVVGDNDTTVFHNLATTITEQKADSFILTITATAHPNGDINLPKTTETIIKIKTTKLTGFYNDKDCEGCLNTPSITFSDQLLGEYASGDCYIDPNTLNTFSVEYFKNQKVEAETAVFQGIICQPTSDTTFKSIKVRGVLQDAPII